MIEHPFITWSLAAGVLFICGALLIQSRVAYPSPTEQVAWYSNTLNTNELVTATENHAPAPLRNYGIDVATKTLPYTISSTTSSETHDQNQSGTTIVTPDDLDALLRSISLPSGTKPKPVTVATSSASLNIDAWTYIPSTLVSTATANARTPLQQDLYQYGNQVGGVIQAYEATHHNVVQTLVGAVNDRHDSEKEAAVERIGHDLIAVGTEIDNVSRVPKTLVAASSALANSYKVVGNALIKSAQAQASLDTDYLTALKNYNTKADSFTHAFVGFALILSINDVTFSQSDPGSVFQFSGGSL